MKLYEPQIDLFQLNTPRGDPADGAVLRNRGVTKVLSNNLEWREKCLAAFSDFGQGYTFTGEDFRLYLEAKNLFPSHPNGWGGLINIMVKRRMIVATGQDVLPKDKSSHGRKIQVYRRP